MKFTFLTVLSTACLVLTIGLAAQTSPSAQTLPGITPQKPVVLSTSRNTPVQPANSNSGASITSATVYCDTAEIKHLLETFNQADSQFNTGAAARAEMNAFLKVCKT